MANRAYTYDLVKDYGGDDGSHDLAIAPYWVVCVVRLGLPLSFSRAKGGSVTTDWSQGAKLRGDNLVIASDCTSLVVSGSKSQHTKALSAELLQTDHNYLAEILPGDWVLAWIIDGEDAFENLLKRIKAANPSDPCNKMKDGLRFVGRVSSIRKRQIVDPSTGRKHSSVTLSGVGFQELDSMFFYDHYLAENDVLSGRIGSWLAKVGLDLQNLFAVDVKNVQKNNSQALVTALIDLIVGRGVGQKLNPTGQSALAAAHGAGADNEAPFAYLVPRVVGALLGKSGSSKQGGIMAYADVLQTIMGVQSYPCGAPTPFDLHSDGQEAKKWLPDFDVGKSGNNRIVTNQTLLGTYLPLMPEFDNRPLWSVLQQFMNPVVNEMYTCLRANTQGLVVPTLVARQIPFTTDVLNASQDESFGPATEAASNQLNASTPVTRFLDLPRWKIHPAMVKAVDLGRSDATRFNFIHVYGQDSTSAQQVTITEQLVQNPPVRDDIDIQRSGLRSYMTTVACATRDQVGRAPATWMALVADRLIGSQYTLNGTIQTVGIMSTLAEGDNVEFDGMVLHVESWAHHCQIDAGTGARTFDTTLTLVNGMRSDGDSDSLGSASGGSGGTPIYAGFLADDLRAQDPGISIDDRFDRTAPASAGDLADSAGSTTKNQGR